MKTTENVEFQWKTDHEIIILYMDIRLSFHT